MNTLSFWFDFLLSANEDHGARGRHEAGGVDAVALLFFVHDGADIDDQIFVGSTFAQPGSQVVIVFAEQAGAQFAVGGEADTGAMTAERLRDRRYQTDFSRRAVGETVFPCGFAALVRDLLERPARVNALVDFSCWNHSATIPLVV